MVVVAGWRCHYNCGHKIWSPVICQTRDTDPARDYRAPQSYTGPLVPPSLGTGIPGYGEHWTRYRAEPGLGWAGLRYQISNAAFVRPYDAMMTSLMEENLENPNPGNFIDF